MADPSFVMLKGLGTVGSNHKWRHLCKGLSPGDMYEVRRMKPCGCECVGETAIGGALARYGEAPQVKLREAGRCSWLGGGRSKTPKLRYTNSIYRDAKMRGKGLYSTSSCCVGTVICSYRALLASSVISSSCQENGGIADELSPVCSFGRVAVALGV